MPSESIRSAVERFLANNHPGPFRWQPVGRGVGGTLWRLRSPDASWGVKTGADDPQMLLAEADGLAALAAGGAVRVPQVLDVQECDGDAYLLMEWLDFGALASRAAANLGEQLARQHQYCLGGQFGWRRDNFIGATPQFNTLNADWVEFWRERRLGFQLRLAWESGYRGALQENGTRLLEKLPKFFAGYTPLPSLLHGDLWGGNWGTLANGAPVIFDPAVYYGDREADIAMSELFGGFPAEFYAAYNLAWPLDAGYALRRDLYNLYHVLNHVNLFGAGYLSQALDMTSRLLAVT